MSKKRLIKKQLKNSILVYDLMGVPNGLDLEQVFKIMRTAGVLFYDSYKTTNVPYFISNTRINQIKIQHVSPKELIEKIKSETFTNS